MPPAARNELSWLALVAILAGVIALAYFVPWLGIPVLAVIVLAAVGTAVLTPRDRRRLRALASTRAGEDIGSFARAFRPNAVDMWIVRAVWDALAPWSTIPEGRVPLRATDRLVEDLKIDPEDLEAVMREIAGRIGRSLERANSHPLYGRVSTIRDLAQLLNGQPRQSAA